jgi:YVTN family beta-propeller protein
MLLVFASACAGPATFPPAPSDTRIPAQEDALTPAAAPPSQDDVSEIEEPRAEPPVIPPVEPAVQPIWEPPVEPAAPPQIAADADQAPSEPPIIIPDVVVNDSLPDDSADELEQPEPVSFSSAFQSQYGSCNNTQGLMERLQIRLRSVNYFTALGLSPAEASQRRELAVQRIRNLSADVTAHLSSLDVYGLQISTTQPVREIAQNLFLTGDYEWVRKDCVFGPSLVPNDTEYATQYSLPLIGAEDAWDEITGSSQVTIAILDSGVDATQEDLVGIVQPGYNTVTCAATDPAGCGTSTPVVTGDACAYHGTQVAAVAAAIGNNAQGMAGVVWSANVLPVRITDSADCTTPTTEMAQGIIWASEQGAQIINVSYSGVFDPTIQAASQVARRNGSLVVFASGNDGLDLAAICAGFFGAGVCNSLTHPDVVIVGATDNLDAIAAFSNTGTLVDLVAPGVQITAPASAGGYALIDGTSFSAPIVSGAAALLLSARPSLRPQDLERLLIQSASDLGPTGKDSTYGYGRIQLDVAMTNLLALDQTTTVIANRKLDFQIPRGPAKFGQAEFPLVGGGATRLSLITQSNSGLVSFGPLQLANRDFDLSELPPGVSVGRGSLFYRRTDTSAEFVFTDQTRTRVYLGSYANFGTGGPLPPVIHENSCGPFQEISGIHLSQNASGETHRLLVADKRANRVYSYTLDPAGATLCTSVVTLTVSQPQWIRSVGGANPLIFVGYKDSGGLKMQAYLNNDLSASGAVQSLTSSSTAIFGNPFMDPTDSDLWVPLVRANDSVADDYLVYFDMAAYPPVSLTTLETCNAPNQLAMDSEGASRYLYTFCPSSQRIDIFDLTRERVSSIALGFNPRKFFVSSDGTHRYIAVLRNEPSLRIYRHTIADAPPVLWDTYNVALPIVMEDMEQFLATNSALLINLDQNMMTEVDLDTQSLTTSFYFPRSIDSPVAQSDAVTHFVSSSVNNAYTLEELSRGVWNLKLYTVGTYPVQLAYRPSRLYTLNRDSDSLSIINLNTSSVSSLALQDRPIRFDWDATSDYLWAINETTESVSQVDISIGAEAVVGHTALAFKPNQILYESSDDSLYIQGATAIDIYDGSSMANVRTATIATGVSEIARLSGSVWATSRQASTVSVVSRASTTTSSLSYSPFDLVSNDTVGTVLFPSQRTVQTSNADTQDVGPATTLASTLNHLFTYQQQSLRLKIWPYDQMGNASFAGLSLQLPFDFQQTTSDALGNLWLSRKDNLQIHRIDQNLQMREISNTGFNRAIDVATNSTDGRIYFLLRNLNAVLSYDVDRQTIQAFSVCQSPRQIIYQSTQNQLLVLCAELNTLGVVTLNSFGDPSGLRLISTDLRPFQMALNATTEQLYITNKLANNLYAYNTTNFNAAPSEVTLLNRPQPVVVNATNNTIHIFYEGADSRSSVAGVGLAVTSTQIGSFGFSKAAVDPTSNRVYAIGQSPAAVYIQPGVSFSFGTTIVTDQNPIPADIVNDATAQKTYISFPDFDAVRMYAEAGTATDIAVGDEPGALLASTGLSRVYVANVADDSVSVISTATNAVLGTASLPVGCGPNRMAQVTIGGVPHIVVNCSLTDRAELFHATTYAYVGQISLRLP